MKKKDLIQPGSERQTKLVAMARAIKNREDTLQALKDQMLAATNAYVREASLQGQSLLEAKALLTHGMWMDWLRVHCPNLSQWTANVYMRVAANWGRVQNLNDATSLRAAMVLISKKGDPIAKKSRSYPGYLECLNRAGKFTGLITKHPLSNWPAEGLDKLREEMEPIAEQLWPDRFPVKPDKVLAA